jgi:hypothetical protein
MINASVCKRAEKLEIHLPILEYSIIHDLEIWADDWLKLHLIKYVLLVEIAMSLV